MAEKRPGAFRRMFGQLDQSALLDVPAESSPVPPPTAAPPHRVESPAPAAPAPPEPPTSSAVSDATSLPDPKAPPPAVVSPDSAALPPSRPAGLGDAPTELLPRGEVVSAELTGLLEAPTSPLLARRKPPPPRPIKPAHKPRKKPVRPSRTRPGKPRFELPPEEKGAKLLEHIRSGTPIHDQPFFDAALPGAMLRGADLSCGQLQRADFSGADLRMADLRESDLRGADLSRADLRGADLSGCRLELTRLEHADLRMANLSGLDISASGSLMGADLRGADLSGVELTAAFAGARIDQQTHLTSGWSAEELAAALQHGATIDNRERFPRRVRLEVFGVGEGMVLTFTTTLSFLDRFVLQGLICAVLGPDSDCQLHDLSGSRMLVSAAQHADLTEVAEVLGSRLWEHPPADDTDSSLVQQINRMLPSETLLNALSAMIDRLDRVELRGPSGAMSWRPPTEPFDALKHLLLKLFIPVELRWWLAVVPQGKPLVRSLPGQDASPEAVVIAAIQGLQKRDGINSALFASLIDERRRRAEEIRAVAALWGLTSGF